MNQNAIDLNNLGVRDLERGDPTNAFTSLSKAANIAMSLIENHHHVATSANGYQFHWVDCDSSSYLQKEGGCTPFLFLRALSISSSNKNICHPVFQQQPQSPDCPCGYAWAIWFNLALCCSVLGTRLGEKGRPFLEMGNDLYLRVQRRVDSELHATSYSPHWQMLAMAISNNQACLFYDLSMQQASMECLRRLACVLQSCSDMEVEDRGDFCLNLQILVGSQTIAPAA